VERDVAFGLGEQLVHVPVEAGDRGEPAQVPEGLRRVVGTPAPRRVHGEQRDVAEHHDRRVAGQPGNVLPDEVELLGAQVPELLQAQRVHQRDEVHTAHVEAVPAVPTGTGAERRPVLLAGVVDRVVLPRYRQRLPGTQPAHHLLHLVELGRLGQMRQVAGVHHERRLVGQRVDLADRVPERLLDRGVGGAGEAEVAVADLDEPQRGRIGGRRRYRLAGDVADDLATGDGEHHGGAEPRAVPQQLPSRHLDHGVTTTVAVMNGWIVQM
jgi:hypothetical protein